MKKKDIRVRSRGQTRWIESTDVEGAAEGKKPRQAVISRIEPQEPVQASQTTLTSQQMQTSHTDRTNAHIRRMRPLTVVAGLAVAFGFVAFEVVPLFSLAFVATLLIACLACLIVGEVVYQVFSPDGVGIFAEYLRHRRLMSELKYIYEYKKVEE